MSFLLRLPAVRIPQTENRRSVKALKASPLCNQCRCWGMFPKFPSCTFRGRAEIDEVLTLAGRKDVIQEICSVERGYQSHCFKKSRTRDLGHAPFGIIHRPLCFDCTASGATRNLCWGCSCFPPLPLEVGPQIQLGGLGERCKLPQRGLRRSPSRNRLCCIFSLKIRPLVATILRIFVRVK